MEKKKIIITSITVAMLLFGAVASSYAYFAARIASGGSTVTSVTAKTLDSFVVNKGNDISLVANQDNFAIGKGDLTSNTTASVTFTARSDEASSYRYNLYFKLVENEFGYTQSEAKDVNGNIIKNLVPSYQVNTKKSYPVSLTDDTPDVTCFVKSNTSISDAEIQVGFASNTEFENSSYIYLRKIFKAEEQNEIYSLKITPFYLYKFHITMNENDRIKTGDIKFMHISYIATGRVLDTFCIDNESEEAKIFDINAYEVMYTPELELTIKKNGETWIESLDITDLKDITIYPFQTKEIANEFYEENFEILRYWSKINYNLYLRYSYVKNYYPEIGNYSVTNFNMYLDDIKSSCNGDTSCESQVDERYNSCSETTDEYFWPTISAEAGATTTDTWEAIVTFKNLDIDQSVNQGRTFSGKFFVNIFS